MNGEVEEVKLKSICCQPEKDSLLEPFNLKERAKVRSMLSRKVNKSLNNSLIEDIQF